jgi:hypothetical protein
MSDNQLLFFSLGGLCLGAYFFWKGFDWGKEARLIKNTPTSKIRSLAMGRVEVYGNIIPCKGKIFRSPFSNNECVWCKWTVEEYRKSGKHSNWMTLSSGILEDHFYLQDDTSMVLIDPKKAEVDIQRDSEFRSGTFNKTLPKEAVKFLKTHNVVTSGILGFNRTLRLRESFLSPDDKAYIMGTAADNPFVEDGSAKSNTEDIIIHKGQPKSFFYISDTSEKKIISRFFWKSFFGFVGGGALILLFLAIILGLFNLW